MAQTSPPAGFGDITAICASFRGFPGCVCRSGAHYNQDPDRDPDPDPEPSVVCRHNQQDAWENKVRGSQTPGLQMGLNSPRGLCSSAGGSGCLISPYAPWAARPLTPQTGAAASYLAGAACESWFTADGRRNFMILSPGCHGAGAGAETGRSWPSPGHLGPGIKDSPLEQPPLLVPRGLSSLLPTAFAEQAPVLGAVLSPDAGA